MPKLDNIVVICGACGALARYEAPTPNHPYGLYHWDEPCRKCGAQSYVAHETIRDWLSGKIKEDAE